MAGLVLLAAFSSRPEAMIAQSLLRSEGIEAFMPDGNITLAEIDPSFMSGWRVMVEESELERAAGIIRDAQLGG